MTMLPITLTIAGACALMTLWLAFRVTQTRMKHNIAMGDAGNPDMIIRGRAHANFSEYTPLFLILLGLLELGGGSPFWLWVAGALFVLGRLAHAVGMSRPAPNALRIGGTAATWTLLGALGLYALVVPYLQSAPGPTMIG